jgi:hypothetical protein
VVLDDCLSGCAYDLAAGCEAVAYRAASVPLRPQPNKRIDKGGVGEKTLMVSVVFGVNSRNWPRLLPCLLPLLVIWSINPGSVKWGGNEYALRRYSQLAHSQRYWGG